MKAINLPIIDAVKDISLDIEINVTGLVCYRARLWLGMRILRFGAWVIGCQSDIKVKP